MWTHILRGFQNLKKNPANWLQNKCYLHLCALIISSWPNAILTVPDLGGSPWCYSTFWPQGSANVPDKTLTTKNTSYFTSQAPPTARVLFALMLWLTDYSHVELSFRRSLPQMCTRMLNHDVRNTDERNGECVANLAEEERGTSWWRRLELPVGGWTRKPTGKVS